MSEDVNETVICIRLEYHLGCLHVFSLLLLPLNHVGKIIFTR